MAAKSPYRTLYFRDPEDYERIREKAKALGVSVSEFVTRAALGGLPEDVGGVSPERVRVLEDETSYWRERFEKMAALAHDMQAEILHLRQEVRMRNAADATPLGTGGVDARTAALAPRILKVLTTLRSADGRYRVWTEKELAEELDVQGDAAGVDALRAAVADLYRLNLVEPQRNGWRARA